MTKYRLRQAEIDVEIFNDGKKEHYVAQFPRTAVEVPKNVLDALFCPSPDGEQPSAESKFDKDAYIDTLERYTAILEKNLREMNISLKKIQRQLAPNVKKVVD